MAYFSPYLIDGKPTLVAHDAVREEGVVQVASTGGGAPFQPIGVGRPLRVQIQHVYSGQVFDTFGMLEVACPAFILMSLNFIAISV